jgi:hypothetical protein
MAQQDLLHASVSRKSLSDTVQSINKEVSRTSGLLSHGLNSAACSALVHYMIAQAGDAEQNA